MADYPNLIHGVPVTIRLAQKQGTTKYDPDTGDPIGKVARAPDKTVEGQPCWKNQTYTVTIDGKKVEAEGYVTFRVRDLIAAAITIKEEDQIVQIGTSEGIVSVNYYVVGIQRRGHYPEFGGHTLIKAWWSEKKPTRYQ